VLEGSRGVGGRSANIAPHAVRKLLDCVDRRRLCRYEKRHRNIPAHVSPCFRLAEGDTVTIGQCRCMLGPTTALSILHNGLGGRGRRRVALDQIRRMMLGRGGGMGLGWIGILVCCIWCPSVYREWPWRICWSDFMEALWHTRGCAGNGFVWEGRDGERGGEGAGIRSSWSFALGEPA